MEKPPTILLKKLQLCKQDTARLMPCFVITVIYSDKTHPVKINKTI